MPKTATLTPRSLAAAAEMIGALPASLGKGAPVMALALLAATFARAQVPLDQSLDQRSAARLDRMEKAMRELRAIVFQGRETGQPVVVQPADSAGQIGGLTDRLNDLDRNMARINGQIEIIRHDLDQARQDASDLRTENEQLHGQFDQLNAKIAALSAPPPPPAAEAAGALPPANPADAFAAARQRLLGGDSAGAEAGFRDYLARFADMPQAAEANYQLGRLLLQRQDWGEAANADIGALRGWPKARWAPEAMLDLSRALIGLNKPADACQTLGEMTRRYPTAASSQKAAAASLRAKAQCG